MALFSQSFELHDDVTVLNFMDLAQVDNESELKQVGLQSSKTPNRARAPCTVASCLSDTTHDHVCTPRQVLAPCPEVAALLLERSPGLVRMAGAGGADDSLVAGLGASCNGAASSGGSAGGAGVCLEPESQAGGGE